MTKKLLLTVFLSTLSMMSAEPMKTPQHVHSSINGFMRNHPGDYPFPTEMTFKQFADHAIDQTAEYFDPDLVNEGDTIFLADWYIPWFTRYVHPKIKCRYILISNDSDSSHPDTGIWDYDEKNGWPLPIEAVRTLLYDSKVAAWFCKNLLISRHPKIFPIPIGQSIIYWGDFNDKAHRTKDYFLRLISRAPFEKKHLLYMNMQVASNPVRPKLAKFFKNKPYCTDHVHPSNTFVTALSRTEFYEELSQSTFTLAPPGYGPDTVRFWEAVVLDCIPIVKHCELDDLYSDLPVLFVHEWEEIDELFLKQKLQEIKNKKFCKEKAYFDYWRKKILATQKEVRQGTCDFSRVEATQFREATLINLIKVLEQNISAPAETLLCKGAVMGLRPFQINERVRHIANMYVHDPWGAWGNEWPTSHLINHTDNQLLHASWNMTSISYFDNPYTTFSNGSKRHLFFDLTYLRAQLPTDLEEALSQLVPGSLICGNEASDKYVMEVLDRFERKRAIKIKYMGDIWYFKKP